jgi:hypothetical protein
MARCTFQYGQYKASIEFEHGPWRKVLEDRDTTRRVGVYVGVKQFPLSPQRQTGPSYVRGTDSAVSRAFLRERGGKGPRFLPLGMAISIS